MERVNIVGVQFRRAGRIYDFLAGQFDLRVGDDVVVETDRGPSLAKVAKVAYTKPPKAPKGDKQSADGQNQAAGDEKSDKGADNKGEKNKQEKDSGPKELKQVLRVASIRDLEEARKLTPEHAVSYARERVESAQLKMTILQADVQFGGNKVILYFSAPGRVDFRDLVKDLAGGLRARVELKQVGARDEAKLVGGLGVCGREYCCSSFLRDFVPVSIKMAKNQNLALNPSKVSGGCGRLLCCLTYENDLYKELRKQIPKKGTRVHVEAEGVYGDVIKGDVLNQVIMIVRDDGKVGHYPLAELSVVDRDAGRAVQEEDAGIDEEAVAWADDLDLAALTAEDGKSDAGASSAPERKARGPREDRGRGRDGKGRDGGGRDGGGRDRGGRGRQGSRSDQQRAGGEGSGQAETQRDGEGQGEGQKKRRRRRRRGRGGQGGGQRGGSGEGGGGPTGGDA